MVDSTKLSSSNNIKDIFHLLAIAAQKELDAWEQDENGVDPVLGEGGICENIAYAMSDVLDEAGLKYGILVDGYDEHSDITLVASDGVWRLDIPWQIYEIHHGYCRWEKIKNAKITQNDIVLEKLSDNPQEGELFGVSEHMFPELEVLQEENLITP